MTQLQFLPVGYLLTVAVETPILLAGLSGHHRLRVRLFAGLWLTACTYPIVVLVLPQLTGRWYLWVAETFAPVAECILFASLFQPWTWRDMAAVTIANLASFLTGMLLFR